MKTFNETISSSGSTIVKYLKVLLKKVLTCNSAALASASSKQAMVELLVGWEDFYCLIWRFLLSDLKIWLPNLFVSSWMRRFLLPNLFAWEDFCCLICLFHLIHNVFYLIVFTMKLFVQIDGIVGDTSCYSACWLHFSFALFIPFPISCYNKMNVE